MDEQHADFHFFTQPILLPEGSKLNRLSPTLNPELNCQMN